MKLNNLKQVRESVGLTQAELADKIGTSYQNISHWESYRRGIDSEFLIKISKVTGHTIDEILREPKEKPKIPVMGTIGDNDEFTPIQGEPTQFEEPPRFSAAPDSFVAKVTGNSLRPLIKDDWNVYYSNKQNGVPDNCIKELSIVKLRDGRFFVKEVRKGTKPNRYTLISYANQQEPMEDVDLEWAARISTFSAPK